MTDFAESVEKSKRDRAAIEQRFGFVPTSVLRIKRGALSKSLFNYAQEHATGNLKGASSIARVDAAKTDAGRLRSMQRRAVGMLGAVREYAQQSDRETVSVMAAELVDFFVRYYSRPGAVYLDPFAGHGVRMQVAIVRGMTYYGMDAAKTYVEYMRSVRDRYELADGQSIEVRLGDSRQPPADLHDGVGDFCFTSPPYWDVEYYGPEPEQLGTGKSYAQFLDGMRDVFVAWRPKFKPGSYVVLNVNDIRRNQRFVPYHADLLRLMADVGFEPIDVWIIDGLVSGLPRAFAVSFNLQRIAPKTHEYALVFRA